MIVVVFGSRAKCRKMHSYIIGYYYRLEITLLIENLWATLYKKLHPMVSLILMIILVGFFIITISFFIMIISVNLIN